MMRRIRIANYRCFGDFEIQPDSEDVLMLLGLNGVGKSTLLAALSVLQRIGSGVSDVESLVNAGDFGFGSKEKPMRFVIETAVGGKVFKYALALELPPKFKKIRVLEEELTCDGSFVFRREKAQVSMGGVDAGQRFLIDWHQVVLPVIQAEKEGDEVDLFRRFLSSMVLIAPMPSAMNAQTGVVNGPLRLDASNFVDWMVDLQLTHLDAYAKIVKRLQDYIFPDLASYALVRQSDEGARVLEFVFNGSENQVVKTRFDQLSDGEKCEVLAAVLIVRTELQECSFCYWDEPDNYLAVSEIRSLVTDLRVAFKSAGVQLVLSSHNLQAIDAVSHENVRVFLRDSHVEPTRLRKLTDVLATPEARRHLDLQLMTGSLYDETK